MEEDSQNMPRKITSKTSSQMALFKSKHGRCQRPGPVGRNPYLNFLREFRKRNCGLSAVETIRRGAKEWNTLPKEKKLQYIEAAFYAPKRRRQTAPIPEDEKCCPKVLCPGQMKKSSCRQKVKKKKKKKKCSCRKKGKKRSKRKKCGKPKIKRIKSAIRKKGHGCKKRKKRKGCKC